MYYLHIIIIIMKYCGYCTSSVYPSPLRRPYSRIFTVAQHFRTRKKHATIIQWISVPVAYSPSKTCKRTDQLLLSAAASSFAKSYG